VVPISEEGSDHNRCTSSWAIPNIRLYFLKEQVQGYLSSRTTQVWKRPDHPGEPTLWGSPRRAATSFPLISLVHGHFPPPKNSSNGQRNTPINFLGAPSRRKVPGFTVNCNSRPYYVFGTFKLATSLLTVWSLTDTCRKCAPRVAPCCTHQFPNKNLFFQFPPDLQLFILWIHVIVVIL
jgi:hypothetical protein